MATLAQRDALLAVPCPWCRAGVKSECTSNGRPITTLEAGCHDARWQAAFGTSAPVVTAALVERHGERLIDSGPKPGSPVKAEREPQLVGAGMGSGDRPW